MKKFGRSTKSALEMTGMDLNQYLALHINKRDLPKGSEVVIMIRDEASGELLPLSLDNIDDIGAVARNSRFYGQTMADGHVFNPLIHRRFIAAQFQRLIRQYGYHGISEGIRCSRTWDYAVDVLRKEVHRLAVLNRIDKAGFDERSRFFTLGDCTRIVYDYVCAVNSFVTEQKERSRSDDFFFLPHHGLMNKEHVRPMLYRFNKLLLAAKACDTYAELDDVLSGFDWLKLPGDMSIPFSFTKPYLESGAYYTLKHHMMFEGLTMYRQSQHDSLRSLRDYRRDYLDLYANLMG